MWNFWGSRLQNVSAQCIVRINREAITKNCASLWVWFSFGVIGIWKIIDEHNKSDWSCKRLIWKFTGLCHILLSSSFFPRKSNLVLTKLGKKYQVKDSQYFSNEWQSFPKKCKKKNRMDIRRCFIKCLFKNQISNEKYQNFQTINSVSSWHSEHWNF